MHMLRNQQIQAVSSHTPAAAVTHLPTGAQAYRGKICGAAVMLTVWRGEAGCSWSSVGPVKTCSSMGGYTGALHAKHQAHKGYAEHHSMFWSVAMSAGQRDVGSTYAMA